jgi:chromosome segregation ATPase
MPQALEAAELALAFGLLGFFIARYLIPRNKLMSAIDDLKAAATAIVANQAALVKANSDLTAKVAELEAQIASSGDAAAQLAAEDQAVAEVAAQLNAAVQPAAA